MRYSALSNYSYSSEYDCSELKLRDQRLQYFDFVLKFVRLNIHLCQNFYLINLDMSQAQDQIKRGID